MSGMAITFTTSWLTRVMTCRGTFAGASTPCQIVVSKPGKPASPSVGTSGNKCERFVPVTASNRARPSLANVSDETIDVIM